MLPRFRLSRYFRQLLLIGLCAFAGCGRAHAPSTDGTNDAPAAEASRPWFEDAAQSWGVDFVHQAGPTGKYWMPQAIGSGVAMFDYDNDGRLDLYFLQNSGRNPAATNRLFHQTADGRFVDATAGSGLDVAGQGMGVAAGDVNNDGLVDLFVTEFGRLRLFVNRGQGKFQDQAEPAGLVSPLWGTAAAFCDYDRDGWLDLVVVNYVSYDPSRPCFTAGGVPEFCPPHEFVGTVTKLYRNVTATSPAVRFEDVTIAAGLGQASGPGLGVLCADFNADRRPDIFVANDGQPNRLWIQQPDGKFRDEAVVRGVAYNGQGVTEANMGVAFGDVDGRPGFDLFVTHLTEERHTLWRQESPGMFQDRTAPSRISQAESRGTGFGAVLADFDLDGDNDLAIANGRIARHTGAPFDAAAKSDADFWRAYAEANQLFSNDGSGAFTEISRHSPALCDPPAVSRGLACGDLDNDGDLDLVVTAIAAAPRLLRNVAPRRGHWLQVRAWDEARRRDAYGAEVTVHAAGRTWSRLVQPSSSYLCSHDPRAHFGLGEITRVDRIEIAWPDGLRETFPGDAVDHAVTLRRGTGKAITP